MIAGMMLMMTLALPAAPQTPANPTVASLRGTLDLVKGWLLKAAEQVPEEHYAFAPAPTVRSLGAIFGHIADANFNICSVASGEKPVMSGSIEKTKKTKAELRDALAQSLKFCEAAFDGMTAARADEVVKFFVPGTNTRLGVLAFNNAHNFEHYGNIVTYMRMKGLVPPSSAGGM